MIGDGLIAVTLGLSALGAVLGYRGDAHRSRLLVAAAFASCTGAVLFLLYLLVSSDFSYVYVYQHTSSDLDTVYRVAALWTGQPGSLLFMLWCLTGAAFLARRWDVAALQAGVNAPMAAVSLHLSPFARQALAPEGLGFSPILQHPMMVFHPPTMFMGYAAAGLMFSAAAVSSFRKDSLRGDMRTYGLAGLLLIGVSLLLGCEWSYEAWQDYWPWDPAFTSSLMTWLVIAAALHLLLAERRWGYFRGSARFLSGLSFVMALLSTFVVRSGSIQSVHGFAEDPRIRVILLMAAAVLTVSAAAFTRWTDEERWPRRGKPLYVGLGSLLLLSLGVLYAYAIFAALLVNTFGAGGASMSERFLAEASYPLGVLGVVLVVFATRGGDRGEVVAAVASAAGAVALHLTGLLDPQGALVGFVALLVGSIAVARLRFGGAEVSHLGLSLLLVGLLVASSSVSAAIDFTEVGEVEMVGPYSVELTDFTYEEDVRFGGRFDLDGRGEGWAVLRVNNGVMKKGVFIDRGLVEDVYLTFDGAGGVFDGELVVMGVHARVIPGMSLVWLGGVLVVTGVSLSLFRESRGRVKGISGAGEDM